MQLAVELVECKLAQDLLWWYGTAYHVVSCHVIAQHERFPHRPLNSSKLSVLTVYLWTWKLTLSWSVRGKRVIHGNCCRGCESEGIV